ncbi:MAG: substrate-binding domain-containing protein [Oscillospiraceae bacterium]|jgi:L-arabinose transport system substrate-binding protein|nr:substrate-binding domain-containing protein [Oscillospiraceae bacterium]
MKKALSILLALVLVFALFACGKTAENPPAATPPAGENNTPAADPGTDADTPSNADTPPASGEALVGSDEWYAADTYDHFDREPYKIAYICNLLSWAFNKSISDSLEALGKKLNYTYTAFAANNDYDAYINQIYTFYDQGYDAFVIGADDDLAPRAYEVCKELGVPFIAESTAFIDDDGNNLYSGVVQAQYKNGETCAQWLIDNYKNYWADPIDTSKLGLIVLDYSVILGIHEREVGARETFLAAFPEAEANYIWGDLVALADIGFSAQGGNQLTTSILTAHPEVEKWFIVANVDDWAMGATRAVEALHMEDRVLISSVQADAFLTEMTAGYAGDVYVSAAAVSSVGFSKLMAANLVTILEGRATAETIWADWIPAGSEYPLVEITGEIITRDTYQEYLTKQVIS